MKASIAIGVLSLMLFGCASGRKQDGDSLAVPPALVEIKVGMTAEQVIQKKGRHFKINPHKRDGSAHLVYDDITVDVRDWAWGKPGQVVGVSPTTDRMRDMTKPMQYEDRK